MLHGGSRLAGPICAKQTRHCQLSSENTKKITITQRTLWCEESADSGQAVSGHLCLNLFHRQLQIARSPLAGISLAAFKDSLATVAASQERGPAAAEEGRQQQHKKVPCSQAWWPVPDKVTGPLLSLLERSQTWQHMLQPSSGRMLGSARYCRLGGPQQGSSSTALAVQAPWSCTRYNPYEQLVLQAVPPAHQTGVCFVARPCSGLCTLPACVSQSCSAWDSWMLSRWPSQSARRHSRAGCWQRWMHAFQQHKLS